MYCFHCGKPLEEGNLYCIYCGTKSPTPSSAPSSESRNLYQPIPLYVPPVAVVPYPSNARRHNGFVNPLKAFLLFFKNTFYFAGRASRSEYFWMQIISILLNVLLFELGEPGYILAMVLSFPHFSLLIRRLHDTNKSFAYLFINLIPVVGGILFLVNLLKGSVGDNEWGPGPC